jgi:hypothetical protein
MLAQTARSSKHVRGSQALSCTTNSLHPRDQRANQPHGMHPKPVPQRAVKREWAAELEGVAALVERPESIPASPSSRPSNTVLVGPPALMSATSTSVSKSKRKRKRKSKSENENENDSLRPLLHRRQPFHSYRATAPSATCHVQPCNLPAIAGSCRVSSAAWLTGHKCATCSVTAC